MQALLLAKVGIASSKLFDYIHQPAQPFLQSPFIFLGGGLEAKNTYTTVEMVIDTALSIDTIVITRSPKRIQILSAKYGSLYLA